MADTETFPGATTDRRSITEARILQAARELFAKEGYDRTTIRSVAGRAEVDPALVMHYFGSKEGLFTEACHAEVLEKVGESADELVEDLLDHLAKKLRHEPEFELGLLRSMLTHEQAGDSVRGSANGLACAIAETLCGSQPSLRAGVVVAVGIGVVVSRYLLELEGLKEAPAEAIVDLLRPCVRSLLGADDAEAGGRPGARSRRSHGRNAAS